jgi:hypothetical protein
MHVCICILAHRYLPSYPPSCHYSTQTEKCCVPPTSYSRLKHLAAGTKIPYKYGVLFITGVWDGMGFLRWVALCLRQGRAKTSGPENTRRQKARIRIPDRAAQLSIPYPARRSQISSLEVGGRRHTALLYTKLTLSNIKAASQPPLRSSCESMRQPRR